MLSIDRLTDGSQGNEGEPEYTSQAHVAENRGILENLIGRLLGKAEGDPEHHHMRRIRPWRSILRWRFSEIQVAGARGGGGEETGEFGGLDCCWWGGGGGRRRSQHAEDPSVHGEVYCCGREREVQAPVVAGGEG